MAKKIKLSKGKVTIVDDEDYEYLNQWKWYYAQGYAVRTINTKPTSRVIMHRALMECPKNKEVDHINSDKLDNRRSNLRICFPYQNRRNRTKSKGMSSKYKGVAFRSNRQIWTSTIIVNGKNIYLGYFKNENDAALAYNKAAIKHFGEFAKLNKINPKGTSIILKDKNGSKT